MLFMGIWPGSLVLIFLCTATSEDRIFVDFLPCRKESTISTYVL